MTSGLQKFLEKIIDYAGLFPPSELPMDEAIQNYARYREDVDNWMLSRFICPASRLHELDAYSEVFRQDEPYRFSIIGKPSEDLHEFKRNLEETLLEISRFRQRHGPGVDTGMLELHFPKDHAVHAGVLQLTGQMVDELSSEETMVFFEEQQGDGWLGKINKAIPVIAAYNNDKPSLKLQRAGYKLRSGGTKAEMFPSVEEVAQVIKLCCSVNIPFKATAGLHHPVRYFDETYQVWAHGFFNVFLAGILTCSHRLPDIIILSILEDDDPDSFFFNEDYIGWRDIRISISQLQTIRRENVISLGSCSFDEPREDLMGLKLF
ncbi:MAG: hypothetical protein WDZ53_05555 [Balneolales bacterium]